MAGQPRVFVDSNVFMRLFDTSDIAQTERAKQLFGDAEAGRVELVVGPPVLFEIAWVLRGALGRRNDEILDVIEAITSWRGLKVSDKGAVQGALALARRTGQHFADSYIAYAARTDGMKIATFNKKHFEKLDAELHMF